MTSRAATTALAHVIRNGKDVDDLYGMERLALLRAGFVENGKVNEAGRKAWEALQVRLTAQVPGSAP